MEIITNEEKNTKKKKSGFLEDIIFNGIDGKVTILGFPFDIGAKREERPCGQENGPDCLRRFLPKAGPVINNEYEINIENLKVKDYGNIFINADKNKPVLEDYLAKLKLKVDIVFKNGGIPISIGGTKDACYGNMSALLNLK